MDSLLTSEILKSGVMGAVFLVVVIPLAWYAKKQAGELKEVQDRRATDAQQTVEKLLALNDKWNSTVSEQVRTVEAIGGTMTDLKHALDGIRELLMQKR